MSQQQQLLPCKFYLAGACKNGSSCKFSHQVGNTSTCQFFLLGNCRYGTKCIYLHQKPKAQATQTAPTPPKASSNGTSIASASISTSTKSQAKEIPTTAGQSTPSNSFSIPIPPQQNLFDYDAFDPTLPPLEDDFVIYTATVGPSTSEISTTQNDQSPSYVGVAKKHVIPTQTTTSVESTMSTPSKRNLLCPFAMNGNCKFGVNCRYTHGDQCPICKKFCLDPDASLDERSEHIDSCLVQRREASESTEDSSRMDCVVCFERVMSKKDPRFGLLTCEHCVCLECIRQWRQNERMDNSKSCPICRQITHVIVPSTIWISDPEKKQAALDLYKARMGSIDCKYYDFGNGTCPFGTSCLYRHVLSDGSIEESRLRIVVGEDETRIVAKVQLSDFL